MAARQPDLLTVVEQSPRAAGAHDRAAWVGLFMPAMMWAFVRNGRPALPAGSQLVQALLRNQRLAGTAGFRRPGSRHRDAVITFLQALTRGDTPTASRLLAAGATLTCGDDRAVGVDDLREQLGGARLTKMLGAGSTVVVSITSDRQRGVLFADIARRGPVISRIRYFRGPAAVS